MKLKGSCHCGNVRFEVQSQQPWPYQRCYCSICRKTAGGGGYCINLGGEAKSLQVSGSQFIKIYRAMIDRDGQPVQSEHERHFCGTCGSHLWAQNPQWPELVHPLASAIDTPLPIPPASVHMMVNEASPWAEPTAATRSTCHPQYPDTSLADWHREHGYSDLTEDP